MIAFCLQWVIILCLFLGVTTVTYPGCTTCCPTAYCCGTSSSSILYAAVSGCDIPTTVTVTLFYHSSSSTSITWQGSQGYTNDSGYASNVTVTVTCSWSSGADSWSFSGSISGSCKRGGTTYQCADSTFSGGNMTEESCSPLQVTGTLTLYSGGSVGCCNCTFGDTGTLSATVTL